MKPTKTTERVYAETKGEPPFNWNVFLDQAIKTRGKSVDERAYQKVYSLSESWVTCACGNQCSILDRDYDGEPLDEKLKDEGMKFMDLVQDRQWGKAKLCLARIEKRSAKLISDKIHEKLQDEIKLLKSYGYTVLAPK